MEYLIQFLKNSTLIELILIAATVLFGLILIPIGMLIVFKAKSRLTVILFMALAFLPLIFGVAAVGYGWLDDQRLFKANEVGPGDAIYERVRSENQVDYVVAGLIGASSTALPFLIGVTGLIIKRPART